MKDINDEISKFQYEFKMLPEQLKKVEDHYLITKQEARQLSI